MACTCFPPPPLQAVFHTYVVAADDPDVLVDQGTAFSRDPTNGLVYGGFTQGDVLILRPCIKVTKTCATGDGESGAVSFSGTVTNCGAFNNFFVSGLQPAGNETNALNYLENVIVYRVADGVTNVLVGPISLFAGQGTNFSASYARQDFSRPDDDLIVATGTDRAGLTVTNSTTARCLNVFGAKITGTNFYFSVATESNHTYKIQFTDTLLPISWRDGLLRALGHLDVASAVAPRGILDA